MTTLGKNTIHSDLTLEVIDYLKLNQFVKGDRLTERQLADSLGVSRSPIRNVLQILEAQNVISKRSTRGYELALSYKDMDLVEFASPRSAVDELYDEITTAQISGDLPEEFNEQDFIDKFSVTRSVLVKVLNRMSHEGLVEKKLGRGWACQPVIASKDAHLKSYEFRLAIEPNILRASTFKIDESRLQLCLETHQKIHNGMITEMASTKVAEINADFHQMLADFSQNDFFRDAVRRQNQVRRLMENRVSSAHERILEACGEHIGILNAIAGGNMSGAANLMTYHLVRASGSQIGLPT
ncbi:MAG: GntR family transcriptional regulator [Kordiimonadaceae bacterium]|nr:GntR family transcriptional regulator [Kordiimonadaceae bacterium]